MGECIKDFEKRILPDVSEILTDKQTKKHNYFIHQDKLPILSPLKKNLGRGSPWRVGGAMKLETDFL